ncbi:Putative beta-lactamase HcpC precursor [Martelella mediterranea DSM 17316]|uniref:Putative beta-lactamase HcpC n=2 Tax=Martelella mediterranea TaxID=293089 RepID=A0A1U9YZS7_9HYPH|nr:Putative beta-lactamase HcpC precursor [Martelella mediterranea DSM 17316]
MSRLVVLVFGVLALIGAPLAMADGLDDGRRAFAAGDHSAARGYFAEAFEDGNAEAGFLLARMLEGALGGAADEKAALALYRKTAEASFAPALNRMGLVYWRGEAGVARDPQAAAVFFEHAAVQGDANAAFNLGKLYLDGDGVEKDRTRAATLFRVAAEGDHVLALNTLGGMARDHGQRQQERRYFERSAALGNAVGLFEMARITLRDATQETHDSVRIDAHVYLNLAGARGHPGAGEALQALTATMDADDIARAQEKARNFRGTRESQGG